MRRIKFSLSINTVFSILILFSGLYCTKVAYATTFSNTYDKTTPAGTDAPSVLDDRDREIKLAVQERENVDHYWPYASSADVAGGNEVASSFTGEHRKITFYGTISDPTQVSGKAHLYMSSDELYYQDDTNTTLKLTSAGTLNIVEADLLGTLTNNTYLTAIDNAGTGTVDLIKADANDVAVVPDNSQTATNAAPTSTTGIANKKYVDDKLVSVAGTQIHNAVCPTSFTDLNTALGIRALVLLNVHNNDTNDVNYYFRKNGQTTYEHAKSLNITATDGDQVWVETDTGGLIEWYGSSGETTVVKILAYFLL